MKHTAWVLVFLVFLTGEPRTARHSVIIPTFYHEYAGARDNRGVAWQDSNRPFLANRLGARYWYNSSSHHFVDNGRALPIIRPNFPVNSNDVIATLGADYCGYLLVMNEPEWSGQDNLTPYEGVDFVNEIRRALPCAVLVGPNITPDGLGWLAQYLEAGGRPFDVWGIHIYYPGADCAPGECIDRLCELAGGDCRVWVTEIGMPRFVPDGAVLFSEILGELDSKVEMMFVYTAVNGCCDGQLDLIVDGELTEIGNVWLTR